MNHGLKKHTWKQQALVPNRKLCPLRIQKIIACSIQPSKFVATLGHCWGFCRGKSVFSLCVGELLPSWNYLNNNIHINFWMNCFKNLHFYTLFRQTPIIAIINNKRKNCDQWIKHWLEWMNQLKQSSRGVL